MILQAECHTLESVGNWGERIRGHSATVIRLKINCKFKRENAASIAMFSSLGFAFL